MGVNLFHEFSRSKSPQTLKESDTLEFRIWHFREKGADHLIGKIDLDLSEELERCQGEFKQIEVTLPMKSPRGRGEIGLD